MHTFSCQVGLHVAKQHTKYFGKLGERAKTLILLIFSQNITS